MTKQCNSRGQSRSVLTHALRTACAGLALAFVFQMTPAVAQEEPVRIGVIAPLTGGGAKWGTAAAEGIKILADEVNARGGVRVGDVARPLEVIAYDDKYLAAEAVGAYNRLVHEDGAKFVFLLGSASTLAVKHNLQDDEVLGLTASVTEKAIDEESPYMLRILRPPVDYMPPYLDWVRDNNKERRVVVVNPNDETGWAQAKLAEALYKERGFEILSIELFERSQVDFAPVMTKVLSLQPEIIELGSTSPATAGLLVRQARELGYTGKFVKSGGSGPDEIVAGAGKEFAEGTINILYGDPGNEGFRTLIAAYEKRVGQPPNEAIISYYDGANILVHAIEKAGTADDATAVGAAIANVVGAVPSIQGGLQQLRGIANREIMAICYVGVIRDGKVEIVAEVR